MRALAMLCAICASPAWATTYYFDNVNGNNNNNGTQGSPKATVTQAFINALAAGDVVRFVATTTAYSMDVDDVDAGTADAYVIFESYPGPGGSRALFQTASGNSIAFGKNSAYFIIRGFTVRNEPSTVTGNCIRIGNDETAASPSPTTSHHFIIENNLIYNCTGNGIGVSWSDFYAIRRNVIIGGGARASQISSSAISAYEPMSYNGTASWIDSQMNTSYNITIENNTTMWWRTGTFANTDGNGIILDDFRCVQHPSDHCKGTDYPHRALMRGNTVAYNEGHGLHVFQSDHVDVIGNTSVENCQFQNATGGCSASSDGDADALGSDDVLFDGNVWKPRSVRRALTLKDSATQSVGTVTYQNNRYGGGNGFTSVQQGTLVNGGNNTTSTPTFINKVPFDFRISP